MVLMPEPGWLLRVLPAEVLKLTLEYFPGPVLFQTGGGPLPKAARLARQAQELGADGILCLPPSYYADAPTVGIVVYLRAVAAAVEIPLVLYNFPRHTRNALMPAILSHSGARPVHRWRSVPKEILRIKSERVSG